MDTCMDSDIKTIPVDTRIRPGFTPGIFFLSQTAIWSSYRLISELISIIDFRQKRTCSMICKAGIVCPLLFTDFLVQKCRPGHLQNKTSL